MTISNTNSRILFLAALFLVIGASHGNHAFRPHSTRSRRSADDTLSSSNFLCNRDFTKYDGNTRITKVSVKSIRGGGNTTPSGQINKNSLKNLPTAFGEWYMSQMESNELRTKCISAGFLALLGDVCAQEFAHYLASKNNLKTQNNNIHTSHQNHNGGAGGPRFDKRRMFAMFCDGFLCTGPILHYVYEFYEKVLPIPEIPIHAGEGSNDKNNNKNPMTQQQLEKQKQEKSLASRKRFLAALLHVLFDNIFMAIFYVFAMMIMTALLEGRYHRIRYEIQNDFIPAVKASWMASLMGLAPMQLISFHCLPMELRVLAVNFQDVIWVMVMSWVTHRNRH